MEDFNLEGFHLCHLDDDAHGILREKRVYIRTYPATGSRQSKDRFTTIPKV